VQEILTAHDYPGNIRELENIVEHAWVMCGGGVIEPRHLPAELTGHEVEIPARTSARTPGFDTLEAEYIRQVLRRHKGHRSRAAEELGVHRTTLQRKMKKLGIEVPAGDGRHRS
jgi:transcriptional regulator with PAS, ATPase and Fis domain